MSKLDIFRKQKAIVTPEFIRQPNTDGTVKLIVILELAYYDSYKRGHLGKSAHKYPPNQFLAECMGLSMRTVFTKTKTAEYERYSPKYNNGKSITAKRGSLRIDAPISLLASSRLTVYEKLVYLNIKCYACEGMDDMSMLELGDDLGIDRIYVNKNINSLIKKGLLTKRRSRIPNAGKLRNIYTLTDEDVETAFQRLEGIELLKVNFGF